MNEQQNDSNIVDLMEALRIRLENRIVASLNFMCGEKYKGKFHVTFMNPSELTMKKLEDFFDNGPLIFYPEDEKQYASLKDFREADGGINISALRSVKGGPDNIQEEEWESYCVMAKEVGAVFARQGLIPMSIMVSEMQRSYGYKATEVDETLGEKYCDEDYAEHALQEVLESLIEKIDALPAIDEIFKPLLQRFQETPPVILVRLY